MAQKRYLPLIPIRRTPRLMRRRRSHSNSTMLNGDCERNRDAGDGPSIGTRVPWMWVEQPSVKPPRMGTANRIELSSGGRCTDMRDTSQLFNGCNGHQMPLEIEARNLAG